MSEALTLGEGTVAYLASLRRRIEAHTLRVYRGELDRMCEYMASAYGVRSFSGMKSRHWRNYLRGLTDGRRLIAGARKPRLSESSARQSRRITQAFLWWCFERGHLPWSPGPVAETMRESAVRCPAVTSSWRGSSLRGDPVGVALLEMPDAPHSASRLRATLVANLAYWGALRPPQIAALRVNSLLIDIECELLAIRTNEADDPWLPLPFHLEPIWAAYRHEREKETGRSLDPHAPVVASLRGERPLTPWSIWAVVARADTFPGGASAAATPRALRAAFIEHTGREAAHRVAQVASHARLRGLVVVAPSAR